MQHRAWSTLEIKSVDRAQRIVEGVASTPDVDRGGDVMDPNGAQFTLPMPFLWQHGNPIGEVFAAKVQADGIHIKARISTLDASAPQSLKDFIDTAWHSISAQPPLVRGLSIGWSPIESEPVKGTRFTRFLKWVWGETSAVVVPMNARATITAVKSCDTSTAAASGTPRRSSSIPGATGSVPRPPMQPTSERLTAEKANLQIKTARLEELDVNEDNGTLEDGDVAERETLITEVKSLTAKVDRLSAIEAAHRSGEMGQLTPVSSHRGTPPARIDVVDHVKALPKGTLFTRYAMAVAAGRGSMSDTLAYAKRWNSQTPQVTAYIKAVEGTSTVATNDWGGELVNPSTIATEFVELLMPQTIIGRVSGFRRVPFNIPIITQTGGSTFAWVGEGDPKPVGELAFSRTTLGYHKVAGIVVLTEELVRLSNPAAEETVRRDLIDQCAEFLDEAFIQISKTAGANNPASITNGVSAPNASGTTLAALMADLNTALGTLTAANLPLDGLVIVTTPEVAVRLSLMVTSLGVAPSGFTMTPTGGTLLGYPVIVSNSVDADSLVIFKPSEIFLASDDRVTIDASNQATLDMAGTSTPTFSLWQKNCVGLRAEQWITWAKRRATVVAVIDTIAYVPGT